MRRREFIALLGGIAGSWSLPVRAQQASTATVGLLWPGAGPPVSPRLESFREGLRRSGFVEDQNVAIDLRYVQAGQQTLADHAADLVRAKVAVIATFGDSATKIAQQATSTIPIVSLADDLLGSGLIGSLSRPGANTTGITILAPELSAKRLELLSTIVPGLARVAGLWDPTTGGSQVAMSANAARTMKLKLQILEVTQRDDLDGVFRAARDAQAQAVNVFSSPFLASLYLEIINRAAEYRLPTIYQWREHAEAGGLISYGPSLPVMWEQDGALVAKVLKGAEPSGLPVEQPTKFELVINLKTARALGLTVSNQMQLLADEVIE
ncbi:MAG: ABC transporter substrate-binding protein [Xanthobacteraceae bacterium]